jgi:L-aspartate oxidase
MPDSDPRAELAPRDIVSRAILREVRRSGHPCVYLDLSHLRGRDLAARFPRIHETVRGVGLDLARDRIPVLPAAHYMMGGVRTDLRGRTSVPGLFAAGEVAAAGVHGANRLASNSLLEGLVFGAAAGEAMVEECAGSRNGGATTAPSLPARGIEDARAADVARLTRTVAWESAGILREADPLRGATAQLLRWIESAEGRGSPGRRGLEAHNMALVAWMIASCAFHREESRGAHARIDHPRRDDARWRRHTLLCEGRITMGPPVPEVREATPSPWADPA